MEVKRLKRSEQSDFAMLLDKTLQRRDKVDSIITNLTKEVYDKPQRDNLPTYTSDYKQVRREFLLKDSFDLKAKIVLDDVKVEVTALNNNATKASVLKFLNSYSHLLTREREICGQDRETILLNLEKEFERMGSMHTLEFNFPVESDGEIQAIGVRNMDKESDVLNVSQNSEAFANGVSTTLDELEQLKTAHKQMIEIVNVQMGSMCACIEFCKTKTFAGQENLMSKIEKLSIDLLNLKDTLSSKSLTGKIYLQKTRTVVMKKLTEAKELMKGWKMQEIILSSLVEHRNKTLQLALAPNIGTFYTDFELKEYKLKSERISRSRQYIDGVVNVLSQIKEFQAEMLRYAKIYQKSICDHLEPLHLTFKGFEKLDTSLRAASQSWWNDSEASAKPSLTIIDCLFEQRLRNTIRRVSTEKCLLANEVRFIQFIARDDSFVVNEEVGASSHTTQCGDVDTDLQFYVRELGVLVNSYITSTKRTFMAMQALKKLDSCLGFSVSKLEVLEFDIINRKTYLECRNNALIPYRDGRNVNPKEHSSRKHRYGTREIRSHSNSRAKLSTSRGVPPGNDYHDKSQDIALPSVSQMPSEKKERKPQVHDFKTYVIKLDAQNNAGKYQTASNAIVSNEKGNSGGENQLQIAGRLEGQSAGVDNNKDENPRDGNIISERLRAKHHGQGFGNSRQALLIKTPFNHSRDVSVCPYSDRNGRMLDTCFPKRRPCPGRLPRRETKSSSRSRPNVKTRVFSTDELLKRLQRVNQL